MGDLPYQTGRRAGALSVDVKMRIKLDQIHRLKLTAAAQRLNDPQQGRQQHAQRRRRRNRRHFARWQHVEIDSQIQNGRIARYCAQAPATRVFSKAASTSRSSTIATLAARCFIP